MRKGFLPHGKNCECPTCRELLEVSDRPKQSGALIPLYVENTDGCWWVCYDIGGIRVLLPVGDWESLDA